MVMITELINRLEEFKDKHGDLPVYITKGFVADTEVDTVTFVRGHQCLLGNHYLDNYTLRISDKIKNLDEDISNCSDEKRLDKLLHYRYLLRKEYKEKKNMYEKNGVDWEGSI